MKKKLIEFIPFCITAILVMASCSEKDNNLVIHENTGIKTVTTYAPDKVTMTSAELRVGTTLNGNGSLIKRGIFLIKGGDPVLSDPTKGNEYIAEHSSYGNNDEEVYSVYLNDLKANTVYIYMAFAYSESDTCYGTTKFLVTSYGTVTDAENNEYQTVKIGNQEWMRENLKATIYSDRESISGCLDKGTYQPYGRHYTFSAATRNSAGSKGASAQGACPTGWHVPGDSEWQELLTYIGVPTDQNKSIGFIGNTQAAKLKDAGTDLWSNEIFSNSTGFSMLPAGICNPDEGDECIQTAFWSSTPNMYYGFQENSEKIFRGDDEPDCPCGISVRCIKDQTTSSDNLNILIKTHIAQNN